MSKVVKGLWPGNPAGATRAARQPCRFEAFVPDSLVGHDIAVSAQLAADLVDVETLVRRLNTATGAAVNLEPLARFLLRAEAVASSNIEGLQINVRRLARSEAEDREGLVVDRRHRSRSTGQHPRSRPGTRACQRR